MDSKKKYYYLAMMIGGDSEAQVAWGLSGERERPPPEPETPAAHAPGGRPSQR
jgi:hypothetical protein